MANGKRRLTVAKPVPAPTPRPSREEAREAVRTLLRWAGDDPLREGLANTPERVVRAYEDWFSGYEDDPEGFLARTFKEVEGYDEMIVLRNIRFESHCEHLPNGKIAGLSKLARVVDAFARRLQVQEKMNAQIANTIQQVLEPKGVAVIIEATHHCMTTRGIHKTGLLLVTSTMLGAFREDARTRREFLNIIGNPSSTVDH